MRTTMATENNNKTLNVPNLRFPEFSGEWERCSLGDITTNFSRRNKEEVRYPMFSVTNNRGFVPQSEQFEDREMVGEDIKAYKIIHKNDFAYNPARINVGSIAKYNGGEPCMISSLYVCFTADKRLDNEWLMQLLKTPKMNFYYNINGEGGVRVYLFYPNFARIKTSFPSLQEQQKISSFLALLDERIATQIKIIEKLESLIKGLCQKLTQQDNPNTALNDTLVCYSSTLQESSVQEAGDYPVYGATGVCGYTDTPEVDGDSILIIKDGASVGVTYYASGKYSAIGTLNRLAAKRGYSLRYLYYCLKVFNFAPYRTGLAIPHIYFRDYGKAKVWCPSLDEQQRIADALSKVELKIAIEKSLLEQLYSQKRFLLQAMFI